MYIYDSSLKENMQYGSFQHLCSFWNVLLQLENLITRKATSSSWRAIVSNNAMAIEHHHKTLTLSAQIEPKSSSLGYEYTGQGYQ